ncbi:MAG TPA: response regulator [Gemmatimonadales bacterium]|nr:response regulator [Gemmatimonadales bacterium]
MSTGPTDGERPLVLVADDEDSIRLALQRFLERQGYRIAVACDGVEALALVRDVRPEALVCDIRMPGMTGIELVPLALAADPDLAIVMLTAVNEPAMAIDCLKRGAADYLIKPVDLDELLLSLQSALRRRQLEIERRELERWLAREVSLRTQELEAEGREGERLAVAALVALVDAVEAGSPDWDGFSREVGALAGTLARRLGRGEEAARELEIAGRLHRAEEVVRGIEGFGALVGEGPPPLARLRHVPDLGRLLRDDPLLQAARRYVTLRRAGHADPLGLLLLEGASPEIAAALGAGWAPAAPGGSATRRLPA